MQFDWTNGVYVHQQLSLVNVQYSKTYVQNTHNKHNKIHAVKRRRNINVKHLK